MSCYGCAKKYSFFNKEKGCPNCGFSYCSSCLKFKALIPKLGRSEHLVCRSCDAALADVNAKSALPDHPAAYLQRLESLENPSRAPITVYKHDQRMQKLKTGLTQTDKELADRLEKLREGRTTRKEPLASEDEIAKRLALLKGQDPACVPSSSKPNFEFTPDTRTQQQQADDLLTQYSAEQALARKYPSATEEITRRLAKLRGLDTDQGESESSEGFSSNQTDQKTDDNILNISLNEANTLLTELREEDCDMKSAENDVKKCLKEIRSKLMKKHHKPSEGREESPDSDDEETDTDNIIKRVLDEAALEEKCALSEIGISDEANSDSEELPWCIICNEDAKRRCESCDGDLYCDSCFKEGHRDSDMKDHHSVAFKPTKK